MSLAEGEQLSAQAGIAVVLSLTIQRCTTPVYNIEVHGEHVDQVGFCGILVHSTYEETFDVSRKSLGELSAKLKKVHQTLKDQQKLLDELQEQYDSIAFFESKESIAAMMGSVQKNMDDAQSPTGIANVTVCLK